MNPTLGQDSYISLSGNDICPRFFSLSKTFTTLAAKLLVAEEHYSAHYLALAKREGEVAYQVAFADYREKHQQLCRQARHAYIAEQRRRFWFRRPSLSQMRFELRAVSAEASRWLHVPQRYHHMKLPAKESPRSHTTHDPRWAELRSLVTHAKQWPERQFYVPLTLMDFAALAPEQLASLRRRIANLQQIVANGTATPSESAATV